MKLIISSICILFSLQSFSSSLSLELQLRNASNLDVDVLNGTYHPEEEGSYDWGEKCDMNFEVYGKTVFQKRLSTPRVNNCKARGVENFKCAQNSDKIFCLQKEFFDSISIDLSSESLLDDLYALDIDYVLYQIESDGLLSVIERDIRLLGAFEYNFVRKYWKLD
jgi:hypothetical protein